MNSFINSMGKVFRFTFAQRTRTKGWRTTTLVFTLLAFIIPALLLPLWETLSQSDAEEPVPVKRVYAADESGAGPALFEMLPQLAQQFDDFACVPVTTAGSADEAFELASSDPESLVLILKEARRDADASDSDEAAGGADVSDSGKTADGAGAAAGGFPSIRAAVVLPEGSKLNMASANRYSDFLGNVLPGLIVSKVDPSVLEEAAASLMSSFTEDDLSLIGVPALMPEGSPAQEADAGAGAQSGTKSGAEAGDTAAAGADGAAGAEAEASDAHEGITEVARAIIAYVLPFVNIMLLYFLILFYGQSTANSVLMEKTSRLMDTLLLSVRPEAMVTGKVLAGTAV